MDLKDSETKENLMRAFAGESQARNRYTFAASMAKENGDIGIQQVFDLTANQEKEHGEVFYDFLKEFDGLELPVDAAYPVNTADSVLEQLRAAANNEKKEAFEIYPAFGNKALEEGFNHIAGKFFLIADIEKTHAERFDYVSDLVAKGNWYVSDVKTGWICLHCGYVVESTVAPQNCPVCDSPQGYFIRVCLEAYEPENCKK